MNNILLDALPDTWEGYEIETDFRIGIMISQCICDNTLSDREKLQTASALLFKHDVPSNEECAKAIMWWMNDYNHDNAVKKDGNRKPIMDFDIDQFRIYAAFMSQYKIDLNTAELHWFAFMGLLSNLDECAFTRVMEIRDRKITSKLSKAEREYYSEQKKVYNIKVEEAETARSLEEQKAIDNFMKFAKKALPKKESWPI